ncbi:MAG: hypothetical protein U9Q81_11040 [Pseudomonadota bacterium]|nr:hypothetical protein [Pseudomonadota bacterium]
MSKLVAPFLFVGVTLFAQQAAFADHNSPHGAGWARMPNDIHNTRIETRGDNTAFRDFVRYGNGASSVNRYLSDSDTSAGGRGAMRTANGGRGSMGAGGRGRGR